MELKEKIDLINEKNTLLLNEVRDEHEISRPKIENKEIKYEFIKNK